MNQGQFAGIGQSSRFKANTGVPLGGLVALPGRSSSNFVVGDEEFLKTSVLKAASGYEQFLIDRPYLGVSLGTEQNLTRVWQAAVAGTSGGSVYALPTDAQVIAHAASTSSAFSALGTGRQGPVVDYAVFGTRLLIPFGTDGLSLLGPAPTGLVFLTSMSRVASNTAGTLAVFAQSVNPGIANGIATTTNGTSTTNRTPTGATLSTLSHIMWAPVSSTFLFIGTSGEVWSTPDGFTMTARASLPASTTSFSGTPVWATVWASSSTSTAFLSSTHLHRTTNGTTFTSTPLSTVFGLDAFQSAPRRIAHFNGQWIAWGDSAQSVDSFNFYRSLDDGVTWQKSAIWTIASLPTTASFYFGQGPAGAFILNDTFQTSSRLATLATPTSPTHVGLVRPGYAHTSSASSQVGYAQLYLRIK